MTKNLESKSNFAKSYQQSHEQSKEKKLVYTNTYVKFPTSEQIDTRGYYSYDKRRGKVLVLIRHHVYQPAPKKRSNPIASRAPSPLCPIF